MDKSEKFPYGDVEKAAKGLVGNSAGWGLCSSGLMGLWREVSYGVEYFVPPFPSGTPTWAQDPRSRIRFEMGFAHPPQAIMTFRWFCEELRKKADYFRKWRCNSQERPDELGVLDDICQKILSLAAHLHSLGHGIGLLCPENIVILRDEYGEYSVTFSDLGFVWGDLLAPVLPTWCQTDYEENPACSLWSSPREQLREQLQAGDEVRDVQVLGRIFCSALLGGFFRNIPDPDEYPDTLAQAANVENARRVWVVLEDAVEGRLRSVTEFATELREYRLSQHFLSEARRRFNPGTRVLLGLLGVGLLAGAVIVGWGISSSRQSDELDNPVRNDLAAREGNTSVAPNAVSSFSEESTSSATETSRPFEGESEEAKELWDNVKQTHENLRKTWDEYIRASSPKEFYTARRAFEALMAQMSSQLASYERATRKSNSETDMRNLEQARKWMKQFEDLLNKELGLTWDSE